MSELSNTDNSLNKRNGPSLWGWHTLLSLGVTFVVLVVLAAYVDIRHLWQEIVACDKRWLLLAGLAHYATYPVRGMRWKYCLRHFPVRCRKARFGLLVFFYNFVDNIVPGKLGDLYASHLAWINCGIRRSSALGSILFLRTVDAWVVFSLAGLVSWLLFAGELSPSVLWALIAGCFFAVATTVVMLAVIFLKGSVKKWFPDSVQQRIEAFQSGMWPKPKEIPIIASLTLVIWGLETLWIYLLTYAFGLNFSFAGVIFLTMIPLIASAFPLTPSGAGAVELTLFSCLSVIGVPAPLAVSLTVVNRFIDYWLHIALGAVLWALRSHVGLRTWRDLSQNELKDPEMISASGGKENN